MLPRTGTPSQAWSSKHELGPRHRPDLNPRSASGDLPEHGTHRPIRPRAPARPRHRYPRVAGNSGRHHLVTIYAEGGVARAPPSTSTRPRARPPAGVDRGREPGRLECLLPRQPLREGFAKAKARAGTWRRWNTLSPISTRPKTSPMPRVGIAHGRRASGPGRPVPADRCRQQREWGALALAVEGPEPRLRRCEAAGQGAGGRVGWG